MDRRLMPYPQAYRALVGFLKLTLASYIEANVKRLCRDLPFFLSGAEHAIVDGGIALSIPDSLTTTHPVLRREQSCSDPTPMLAPIEIKTMGLGVYRGRARWLVHFNKEQYETCAAVIVQNADAADLVAVVPIPYCETETESDTSGDCNFASLNFAANTWTPDPFPPTWVACVMPTDNLAASLRSMYGFCQGSQSEWTNPANGVVFRQCSPPQRHAATLLKCCPAHTNHEYAWTLKLVEAFERYSRNWRVEEPLMMPLVGDILLIHKETGERRRVELKRECATWSDDGLFSHTSGRMDKLTKVKSVKRESLRFYFDPDQPWDLLLTGLRGGGKEEDGEIPSAAAFIWRAEVPEEWLLCDKSTILTHRFTPEFRRRRLMNFQGRPRDFVEGMEEVLRRGALQHNNHGDYPSKIFLRRCVVEGGDDVELEEEDMEVQEETIQGFGAPATVGVPSRQTGKGKAVSKGAKAAATKKVDYSFSRFGKAHFQTRTRDTQKNWWPGLWDAQTRQWVMEQCKKHGFGNIHALGGHPYGRHVFFPHAWPTVTPDELQPPVIFSRVQPQEVGIILEFVPLVEVHRDLYPYNRRRHVLDKVMNTDVEPLYIIEASFPRPGARPEEAADACFIVPATLLRSDKLRTFIEAIEEKKNVRHSHGAIPITLTSNSPMDSLRTTRDELIPLLQNLCNAPLKKLRVREEEVDVGRCFVFQREILQAFIDDFDRDTDSEGSANE